MKGTENRRTAGEGSPIRSKLSAADAETEFMSARKPPRPPLTLVPNSGTGTSTTINSLVSASPLYPHMERMSLQAAASSDFALDATAAAAAASLPSSSISNTLLQPTPIQSSVHSTLLSPSSLLFKPSTTSQLKFKRNTSPILEETSAPASPPPSITVNGEAVDCNRTITSPTTSVSGQDAVSKKLDNLKLTSSKKQHKSAAVKSKPDAASEDNRDLIKSEPSELLSTADATSSSTPVKKGSDEKKFPCTEPDCSATFAQLAHLKIHLRRHTGERPFVCAFCDKTFNQKGNLKTHERKHTGDKPFKCQHPGCTKEFSQQGNLRTHEKIHLNVKQFTCEQCSKSFSQFGNLKSHIQKVHEKPQIIRRPRANSNASISKSHKSSAAIAVAAAVGAGRPPRGSAGGAAGSFLLDRYYTPSLASRSAPKAGVDATFRNASLATPPPSDWSLFDRDLLNGFGDISSDDEEDTPEEEEEEEDEDEFDEFDEFDDDDEEEEEDVHVGVMGGMEGVDVGPQGVVSDENGADEEAKLLLYMLDTTYGRQSVASAASSVLSPPAVGSPLVSSIITHNLGTSYGATAGGSVPNAGHFLQPLSPSLKGVGNHGGVKKRKEKKLPTAAATQVRLRGRSLSMGRLDAHDPDGLQFRIEGLDEQQQQHLQQHTTYLPLGSLHLDDHMMMEDDFALGAAAGSFEDQEAARVLASVSFDTPNAFQSSSSSDRVTPTFRNPHAKGRRSSDVGWDRGGSKLNMLPLLATAAATASAQDAATSSSYSGGVGSGSFRTRHPPVTFSSTSYQNGGGGFTRHSHSNSVGSVGAFSAKSFERNVMSQFVDAVAKRTAVHKG
ncbi:hypothetical protein HDU77_002629 [Chytriomyces hyalinus]|nr:hypothetical protein HDU77_002629 [Chytriomyces hyalinus]